MILCATPANAGVQYRAALNWPPAFAGVVCEVLALA